MMHFFDGSRLLLQESVLHVAPLKSLVLSIHGELRPRNFDDACPQSHKAATLGSDLQQFGKVSRDGRLGSLQGWCGGQRGGVEGFAVG